MHGPRGTGTGTWHGHSGHHVQGAEVVGRDGGGEGLVLNGCGGDFVGGYAVREGWRSDLSALWWWGSISWTVMPRARQGGTDQEPADVPDPM